MSGNEAKTRKDIIDKRLQVAGWNVSDHTQVVEEFDIDVRLRLGVVSEPQTKYSGHQFSDYVLDYLNAITLGLTAPPCDVIHPNTFRLFECKEGVPTYAYSYDQAVNNSRTYFSNFRVMKTKTTDVSQLLKGIAIRQKIN